MEDFVILKMPSLQTQLITVLEIVSGKGIKGITDLILCRFRFDRSFLKDTGLTELAIKSGS